MPGGCRQLPRLAYLVPGDLMLVGKTRGAYSCVSYQSAADRKQYSTVGRVRSTSLTPVLPTRRPRARIGSALGFEPAGKSPSNKARATG
jgi:hypothetical protein